MLVRYPPAILVLTGASGAGKTTLIKGLEAMQISGIACFNCDVIYHNLPEEIRKDGLIAQDAILSHWVSHVLNRRDIEVATLDTQIRPHRAQALLSKWGITTAQIVLVECEQHERTRRLHGPRGQPELDTAQMESWAAYLRGQADALGLESINTSGADRNASVARLLSLAEDLRAERNAALAGQSKNEFVRDE